MGGKNRERWTPEAWRVKAPTIADMHEQGWHVVSECGTCGLKLIMPLLALIKLKGPGFSLWCKDAPCRKVFCPGKVRYLGRPPGLGQYLCLEAEWIPTGIKPGDR